MSIQRLNAKNKGLDFHAEYLNLSEDEMIIPDGKFSPIINCDEQRIMQVLLGLQSNALKFTSEGKIVISVAIVESDFQDGDRYVEISVEDSGIGIDEEDQSKLFKLFGFVQDSQQMNTQGIGLGLVIADQIVSRFDGSISF